MTVLVTGGAGFIGSHLCVSLLKQGHRVVVIDNFNDFYPVVIKRDNARILKEFENCVIHEKDITNEKDVMGIFSRELPECVYHLAACAGVRPSLKQPFLYEKVNVVGTMNILEASRKYGVKKFIFGSSSSVYGEREKVPFREDDLLNNIVSPYAATKAAGEHFCRCYHSLYGLNTIVLRFFTVYGPRQRPEMAVCKFARMIDSGEKITVYGDGTSSRDYTFIDDIVQGLLGCLDADLKFDIINLGEATTIYLSDLVRIIEKHMGMQAKIEYGECQKGDVSRTFADITKARNLIGYDPQVNIEEGVKKFVSWYKSSYSNGIYRGQKSLMKNK
ncbi:MAG: GDP-mannose 4,6-dehydratase [Candidatus Aureabacteria bacterium]|nr:GDP-mannose 4,6-dehydratase [Candidatus Auribacterota bacterium]